MLLFAENLYLQGNMLTGSISSNMASLAKLRNLNLSGNPSLGGDFGQIFGGLVALGEFCSVAGANCFS